MKRAGVVAGMHWKMLVVVVVIAVAELGTAWLLRARGRALDHAIYEQCIRDEQQDAVIVAQLSAAKFRVVASLPAGSLVRAQQLTILNDGIAALEPPGEQPCQPPRGFGP